MEWINISIFVGILILLVLVGRIGLWIADVQSGIAEIKNNQYRIEDLLRSRLPKDNKIETGTPITKPYSPYRR